MCLIPGPSKGRIKLVEKFWDLVMVKDRGNKIGRESETREQYWRDILKAIEGERGLMKTPMDNKKSCVRKFWDHQRQDMEVKTEVWLGKRRIRKTNV